MLGNLKQLGDLGQGRRKPNPTGTSPNSPSNSNAVYLTDDDGNRLTDDDGNYLIEDAA